ncbi:F5/8 type C domain protein [compost metagenome]
MRTKISFISLVTALGVLVVCFVFGGGALASGQSDGQALEPIIYSTSETPLSVLPNIVTNKPSYSSSVEAGYPTANAFDGDPTTRWSSEYSDPQWISIALVGRYYVDRVKIDWEAAYASAYKIQVSRDNVNWTDVYSTTSGDGGTDDITFAPADARFIRIYCTQRATNWGYSIYEIEADGVPHLVLP